MNTTLRDENNKRVDVVIPDSDRMELQRMKEKGNYKSLNDLIWFITYKYEDDRQFIPNWGEFVKYCIKREIKGGGLH